MSIKVQYLEVTIPSGSATFDAVAPTHFTAVNATNRTFLLPATTLQHCGIGEPTGTSSVRHYWVTADLQSTSAIRFERGAALSTTCVAACWIVEFTGSPGDSDEFRVEKTTTTVPLSSGSQNSAALTTITNINKTVPILHVRGPNDANNNVGQVACGVQVINDGSNNVNQLTRLSASATVAPVAIVYNVEWVHASTTVQAIVNSELNPDNTDADDTISAVNVSNSFVYAVLKNQHDPDDLTYYTRLSGTTIVRSRAKETGTTGETLYAWVVSNPTFNVQHVDAVDSVIDLGAGTNDATVDFPISIDQTRALVIGHAGSSDTANTGWPAGMWLFKFATNQSVGIERVDPGGSSEYSFQVVQFAAPEDPLPEITSVTSPTDTESATITGTNFGAVTGTVTIGGEAQTVTNWTDTSITYTAVQGDNPFLMSRILVITRDDAETDQTSVQFQVDDDEAAVTIAYTDFPTTWRFNPNEGLAVGDQIHCASFVGTPASNFTLNNDGSWESSNIGLTQFQARVWDASDETWSAFSTQTVMIDIDEPVSEPEEPEPSVPGLNRSLFCDTSNESSV